MKTLCLAFLALLLLAVATEAAHLPADFDDYEPFDWTAAGPYMATGKVRLSANGVLTPTENARFIIHPASQRMYFDLGASGGGGWVLPNGTFNYAPKPDGSGEFMCASTTGTYSDSLIGYSQHLFHKGTFDLKGRRGSKVLIYQGAVNDTSSCTSLLPTALATDEDGHMVLMDVTYRLCPAPNYPIVIEQLVQYDDIRRGGWVGHEIPPLPVECHPENVIDYCELFYSYEC
jgi:hypothetical protein